MAERTDFKKIMKEGGKLFLPSLSLDCVIFGFHNGQLKVLLLKMEPPGRLYSQGGGPCRCSGKGADGKDRY